MSIAIDPHRFTLSPFATDMVAYHAICEAQAPSVRRQLTLKVIASHARLAGAA